MTLEKRTIHPGGPELSKISGGMWRLHSWDMKLNERISFVEKCIDLGITTFDHADIYGDYGNEALFGEILKKRPGIREQIQIVTKCGICLPGNSRTGFHIQHYNTSGEHIRNSIEQSLKNLHTDFLDLVLIHRPDPLMDASEAADTFMQLIAEKKINHVGVSNFTPSQYDLFQNKLDHPLVTNQVECSLLHINPLYDGTLDQAQKVDASPMIWSPFAGGRLFHEQSERAHRIRNQLHLLSDKYDSSIDQLALAWLLKHPSNPFPVVGTGKIERIKSAAEAVNITLDRQDWFTLLKASRGHDVA